MTRNVLFTALTFFFGLSAQAQDICKFEKPIEEAFMDAQYRDTANPIQDARRESLKRVRAMGALAWAELGVYHSDNPAGVKPGFYSALRHATDCYYGENMCDQPANQEWVVAYDKLQKGFAWTENSIPEYAPATLVAWAEDTLNCENISAPISFEKGRVTDFNNTGKLTVQVEQCKAGNYSDCVAAADYSGAEATSLHLEAAIAGCDLNGKALCLSAGEMLRDGQGGSADEIRALEMFERGCGLAVGQACFAAGALVATSLNDGQSMRPVFDFYYKACNLSYQDGCAARDRTLASMGGVSSIATGNAFQLSAEIEAQFDAATLEEIKWGRFDNAGYVARTNCYNERIDVVRSCFAAGWIYEYGLGGGAKDELAARSYYAEACMSGSDGACYRYQGLLYEGRGGDRDLYGASDLLARNCRAGEATACDHYHFGVLTTDAFIPAERVAAAFDYYTWYCGDPRNDQAACFNLAILYDNPGFGRHDETIAKHLANQACSRGGVSGACQMIESLAYRQQQRDLAYAYSQSRGGLGSFLSDLGKGISKSSEIAAGKAATRATSGAVVRPQATSPTLQTQDWRNFNNAVQAIENTGTAFNSNCPASNPYC